MSFRTVLGSTAARGDPKTERGTHHRTVLPETPEAPLRLDDFLQHGFATAPLRRPDALASSPATKPVSSSGTAASSDGVESTPDARAARGVDRAEISSEARTAAGRELTEDQQHEVDDLRKRDREVRSHEQAHKSAAGAHAGAIAFEFETGPDGRRYAVGGSVPIDTSPVPGDPDATIRKMEQVRKAAVAPAQPSAQDRQVMATAQRQLNEARAEKLEQSGAPDEPDHPSAGDGATSSGSIHSTPSASASGAVSLRGYSAHGATLSAPARAGALLDLRA
ncbi:MAG: hypothetical protein KDC38_01855 [Planctomycetes bacterium]|nr:hypothetical protein [Planctomycetota bacterium]